MATSKIIVPVLINCEPMSVGDQPLTHAELSCLQYAARGKTANCIARRTQQRPQKVEALLASARRKLMANTIVEAIARAIKFGLIE
jgi:DNA-binding CsgD family transcriptional regulator